MALQNLDISDALIYLGAFLKKNENIKDFCRTNLGKDATVYVGDLLRKDIPDISSCPYVVLTDFKKKEGQNIEFCSYDVTAFVGVATEKLEYVVTDGVYIPDIYDLGAKLMTLIEHELNRPDIRERPISRIDVSAPIPYDPAGRHWVGKMDITFRIYQTLGTCYQERL